MSFWTPDRMCEYTVMLLETWSKDMKVEDKEGGRVRLPLRGRESETPLKGFTLEIIYSTTVLKVLEVLSLSIYISFPLHLHSNKFSL